MKKIILTLAFAVGMVSVLSAQIKSSTVGLRLGYDSQEISFQSQLGDENRLELGLGSNSFGTNMAGDTSWGVAINGVYQWVWDLSDFYDGFNWYAGFGGALVSHSKYVGVGALGQVGIEYNFEFPLQLSLDYRPGFYIIPGSDRLMRFSYNTPCIGVRYCF